LSVYNFSDLGVVFDCKLNFTSHIDKVENQMTLYIRYLVYFILYLLYLYQKYVLFVELYQPQIGKFCPFVVETFGVWGPEAASMVSELGRRIAVFTREPRSASLYVALLAEGECCFNNGNLTAI